MSPDPQPGPESVRDEVFNENYDVLNLFVRYDHIVMCRSDIQTFPSHLISPD